MRAEKALTDFYPGRNVCKSCINTRHQYRDAKGEPVHISEEAQALEKQYGEKTINDLYDQDREIVYGIDDLAEELGAIADTYNPTNRGLLVAEPGTDGNRRKHQKNNDRSVGSRNGHQKNKKGIFP